MKTLVIYYSLEGNTKLIADAISKELSCDVLRLNVEKDIPKKGFLKFVWGGKQVIFNQKPELEYFNENFDEYGFVIIGSPVWAGSYVPAFNSFFSKVKLTNKKIALFSCYGGSEGKIFSAFKNQLQENEIIGQIGFKDPLKNNTEENIDTAKQWIRKITS